MRFRILTVFALVVFCVAGAPAQGKNTGTLKRLIKQMVDAQAAFDVSALEKLTTADYIEISPLGEFDPREKMLGFYKPELKPKGLEVKTDLGEVSVRDYGKFAVVIARLNYSMTMEGKAAPSRSIRATYVCLPEKGTWKIASAHYTSIRPAAPPQQTSK
jgi:ketosteroid isomerase-like protein